MFYSYFVYTLLVFSISIISYYAYRNKSSYSVLWIPIIIYSLVLGCRYGVGTDWYNYKDYYIESLRGNDLNLEYLFATLNKVVAYLGFDYPFFFFIVSFIHIKCLYTFLLEHRKILFFGILLFFLGGPFITSLNIIRQVTSFFIFLLSIKYIIRHDWKRYLLLTLIAYGFHSSSIILLPLYFVNRININLINRSFILSSLFLMSLLIGKYLLTSFVDIFFANITSMQYMRYESSFLENNLTYGFGFLSIKVIDFLLIFLAPQLLKNNSKEGFHEIWWIYYIGVLIFNIGMSNELIIRLSFCLVSLRFIVLAFLFDYSFSNVKKHKVVTVFAIVVLLLNIIAFYSSVANSYSGCSPFQFFFEINSY